MHIMLKPYLNKKLIEAGCDEAGRGCLAGPVVAAAVILPKNYRNEPLNDSKTLSEKKRDMLRMEILNDALAWGIGVVSHQEIDKINILNASFLAMHRAIDQLHIRPEQLLIDGNHFNPYQNLPYHTIVKGDGKYLSIAAASILAKTHRDAIMQKLHLEFPNYGWNNNKGYPTRQHIIAVEKFGQSPYHRKSFHVKRQLSLDF